MAMPSHYLLHTQVNWVQDPDSLTGSPLHSFQAQRGARLSHT